MAFKVGDKVKIVSVTSHPEFLSKADSQEFKEKLKTSGETGVVLRIDESNKFIQVERNLENKSQYINDGYNLASNHNYFWYFEQNLELIKKEESKMKFKIGDKVKTARKCGEKGNWTYGGNMPADIVGEVLKIDHPENYITVDIGSHGKKGFHPDELDLVPNESKTSEVVPFLKSIEEVQSFVKESKEQFESLKFALSQFGGHSKAVIDLHQKEISDIKNHIDILEKDRVKPTTTSIFDSLNSPEEAVSFLVSEWVKCTNPKVKNEHSSANMITDGGNSNIQFRFSKR